MRYANSAIAIAILVASGAGANAHPHIIVDARAEIVFDADGKMAAIRNIWQFDEAFTAFAIQGLDGDGDGTLTDEELAPLAKVNVESLQEFGFFTYLVAGKEEATFSPPDEYWLEFYDGRLTLFYTLPLGAPLAVGPDTTLEIFDPEYYVAFNFVPDAPVRLVDAPAGCDATYQQPGEIDAQTMTILGSLPADQRDLPPELQDAAADLASLIRVACK